MTYHAVILRLRDRYGNAVLGIEILREEVNDGTDPMVPNPYRPPELRHGVIEDHVPQVAFTLHSVASQGAWRADAGAYAHGDRISSVVDVCDVLSRRLEDGVMK